jgi:hypothetical protein
MYNGFRYPYIKGNPAMTSLSRRNLLATAPAALALGAAGATAAAMPAAAANPDQPLFDLIAKFNRLDSEAATLADRVAEIDRAVQASVPGHDWSAFLDGHGDMLFKGAEIGAEIGLDAGGEENTVAVLAIREVMRALRAKAEDRISAIRAARTAAGYDALEAQETAAFAALDAAQAEIVAARPVTLAGCAALARFASRINDEVPEVFDTLAESLADLVKGGAA